MPAAAAAASPLAAGLQPVVVIGGGFIGLEVASGAGRPGPATDGGRDRRRRCGTARSAIDLAGMGRRTPGRGRRRAPARGRRRRGSTTGPRGGRRRAARRGVRGRRRSVCGRATTSRQTAGIAARRRHRRRRRPARRAPGRLGGRRRCARGRPSRVEHWHAAREAGERAALSMLGRPVPACCRRRGSSPRSRGRSVDVVGAVDGWDEERWLEARTPEGTSCTPGRHRGRAGRRRRSPGRAATARRLVGARRHDRRGRRAVT